jgi:GR25 family glycosyltransferase involved in LPS biosynthesis
MKKDIGRYHCSKPFIDSIGGKFIDGVVKTVIDKGIHLKKTDHDTATQAATDAKINVFNKFLNDSNDSYLIVFEDDIICHNDFTNLFSDVVKSLNKIPKWKLVYLGVSTEIENTSDNRIQINNYASFRRLPNSNDKIYTGAYGFIINRNIVSSLIKRSLKKELYGKPFDIDYLGYIKILYPDECWYVDPFLVLSDVTSSNIRAIRDQEKFSKNMGWEINKYIDPIRIPLFILSDNNLTKLERFLYSFSSLVPAVKFYIIMVAEPDKNMQNYLWKASEVGISYKIYDGENIPNFIESNYKIETDYFYLSNIYTSISGNLERSFFSDTENIFSKYEGITHITWQVSKCPICVKENRYIATDNLFNGFYCIRTRSIPSGLTLSYVEENSNFYLTSTCKEISDNDLHNLTKYDIVSFFSKSYLHNWTYNLSRTYENLEITTRWLHKYFHENILKCIEIEYDANSNYSVIEIEKRMSSKLSRQYLALNKYDFNIIQNGIIIYLNEKFVRLLFGIPSSNAIFNAYRKFGKSVPDCEIKIVYK